MKDLKRSGAKFPVVVLLLDEYPYNTIIATMGNPMFRGPLPEITEGAKEKAVRERLMSKGNLPLSRVCRLLGITTDEYHWEVRLEVPP